MSVLDFGGSLGSVYFQYKHILKFFKKVQWNIVEQKKIVKYGKKFFEDGILKFFYDLNEYEIYFDTTNLILLSGVIQYLEHPYKLLSNLMNKKVKYIVIDRIPLTNKDDKITIQHNYFEKSSYPVWLLNQKKLINFLNYKYELLNESNSFEGTYKECNFKFLLFRLQNFTYE